MKPNFLIVGAGRCGTTSVAFYLAQRSDVFISPIKEPRFFVRDTIRRVSRLDPLHSIIKKQAVFEPTRYMKLFETNRPYRYYGEASIHYLNHPDEAIPSIKKFVGDIPIIIILSNPVDRIISNWKFLTSELFDLPTALAVEPYRKAAGYNSFWFYTEGSMYYERVKKYLDSFSNVLVLILEKFSSDTAAYYSTCLDFLGLSPSHDTDISAIHNPSFDTWYLTNSSIVNHIKHNSLRYYFASKATEKFPHIGRAIGLKHKSTLAVDKGDLMKHFLSDVDKLSTLLREDLSIWTNAH
ncbi:MAG TPA: sulfotransferase domain-containing protein [Thermodesulfobacteriota bacterium]|nr:sulfotransferase domain-containing protein [Thermodesulfobacteriota bacterium]